MRFGEAATAGPSSKPYVHAGFATRTIGDQRPLAPARVVTTRNGVSDWMFPHSGAPRKAISSPPPRSAAAFGEPCAQPSPTCGPLPRAQVAPPSRDENTASTSLPASFDAPNSVRDAGPTANDICDWSKPTGARSTFGPASGRRLTIL